MFLPLSKAPRKRNPLQVTSAQQYLVAFGTSVLGGVVLGGYGLFYMVQKRERPDVEKPVVAIETNAKKVMVIGGSAAGSSAAAVLSRIAPEAEITVFEPSMESTLLTHWPLAQAGHRSYDLATGAPKTLVCPTSWTVTRDVRLIRESVQSISPGTNTLIDGSGATHKYDALILACGSQPNIEGCGVEGLTDATIDRHRVCMSPGITRDTLASIYSGDILCAKLSCSHGGPPGKPFNMRTFAPYLKARSTWYERQCESAFPASVNMLWMFADYFRKGRFHIKAFTDEDSPCKGLTFGDPSNPNTLYSTALLDLWAGRDKLHYYPNQRLVGINAVDSVAVFEEVPQGVIGPPKRTSVPFKLLYLDLPRKAPRLIEESGLSGFSGPKSKDSAGFAAVDKYTLQHVRHPNIFAVGDCAALPTIKSYSGAFTQVHVVAHNVSQILEGKEQVSARYDGFASMALPMTPFRYMLPEVKYGAGPHMDRSNRLWWDDSAWKDLRGFVNAIPHQFYAYELLHWFVFMRGHWNPPTWFTLPDFEKEA